MSVTVAAGFTAAGVTCGVKAPAALDLTLVVGRPGTIAAGMLTLNRAAAAPVALSRAHLASESSIRAIVLNSGCANAATGVPGDAAALEMAETVARRIGCAPSEVLVASTGTIGTPLPVIRVTAGIDDAAARLATGALVDRAAAMAIMTTDTVPKLAMASADGVTVGGMAKGAGMVRPDMATMLVVLTTDADVDAPILDSVLRTAVDESFHCLNIDGCSSTNDGVFLLASGASDTVVGEQALGGLVSKVCRDLAYQLAADAEGASRVVTINVNGAVDNDVARHVGRSVADSDLVRAAFYGGDPNWGRIVGALGAAGVAYEPADVSVGYAGVTVAAGGTAADFDETGLLDRLATGDFVVDLSIGGGPGRAEVLTTDLTPEYVTFNSERS